MTAKTQPPAPQLALIDLSKTMARDFTGWVEGAKSQTKFVVDMADHLVALKDIAESTQSRPEAELPELPESYGTHCVWDSVRMMKEPGYTADQLRAYGQQCAATRTAEVGGDGWLPIESAETNISVNDPTRCLVYGPDIGVQFGAVWKRADGTAGGRAEGFQGDWKITHFRPEPGAPLE